MVRDIGDVEYISSNKAVEGKKHIRSRFVFQALQFPLQLGTILTQMFLHVKAEEDLTSLAGRIATYPADWAGLPPLDLALCGMYLNDRGMRNSDAVYILQN